MDGGQDEPSAADPTPSSTPGEVLGVDPDDLGALTVVPGSTTVEGISVGYPHTIPGAVSAAVEYFSQYGSTLEPERGKTVIETVTDPALLGTPSSSADGPANMRKALGLPATGPVPEGYSVTVAPASYQLREPSDERLIVLLLFYATTQTPQAGSKSSVGVVPLEMRWVDNDWKLGATVPGDPYLSLAATPNTQEAAAAGWKGLTR